MNATDFYKSTFMKVTIAILDSSKKMWHSKTIYEK